VRKAGVEEWLVEVVVAIYEVAQTVVGTTEQDSSAFDVKVRLSEIYTMSQKKQGTTILSITSPNVDRFSNFFSLTDSLVNMQQNRH